MRLEGKVALITGGASGMGAATAKLFAKEGAKVLLTDMLEEEGQAVADGIVAANGAAQFQAHNIADEESWQSAAKAALDAYGAIDILVNNAGISGSDPDLLSRDVWDGQMSVNATGTFLGMRTIIPHMQKQKRGAVVNISSISGVVGQSFVHMGYNASKGAVRMMTKAAAVQFAPDGIRVNSVHPGLMPAMRTSMRSSSPAL